MARLDYSGKDLSHANFVGQSLNVARFRDATLVGADFSRAQLLGADFARSNLTDARFDGAICGRRKIVSYIVGAACLTAVALVSFLGSALVVLLTAVFAVLKDTEMSVVGLDLLVSLPVVLFALARHGVDTRVFNTTVVTVLIGIALALINISHFRLYLIGALVSGVAGSVILIFLAGFSISFASAVSAADSGRGAFQLALASIVTFAGAGAAIYGERNAIQVRFRLLSLFLSLAVVILLVVTQLIVARRTKGRHKGIVLIVRVGLFL